MYRARGGKSERAARTGPRRKKERKKERVESVAKKWGGEGNARETKTNQASVCWRVDPWRVVRVGR